MAPPPTTVDDDDLRVNTILITTSPFQSPPRILGAQVLKIYHLDEVEETDDKNSGHIVDAMHGHDNHTRPG